MPESARIFARGDSWKALKRLGREFRYRALPDVVGSTTTVNDVHDVERAARDVFDAAGLPTTDWRFEAPDETWTLLMIRRYDLLDVCFRVPVELLDGPGTMAPVRALAHLKLVDSEMAEILEDDPGMDCLPDAVASLRPGEAFVRLLLSRARRGWAVPSGLDRSTVSPADLFPRLLRAHDACVSNSREAWAKCYFYM